MPNSRDVYVEVGKKRAFAGGLDWPGWCRSGRDEGAAIDALVANAERYKKALRSAATGFTAPAGAASVRIVERLEGNATTEFGAPAIAPAADERPLRGAELERQLGLLEACWAAFGASAKKHASAVLRKGPRGGGRELPAIVSHVLEADRAYLSGIGGVSPRSGASDAKEMTALRAAILEAVAARARGEPPAKPRRSGNLWLPRYLVRRSAWHALDHAWEIEDRAS